MVTKAIPVALFLAVSGAQAAPPFDSAFTAGYDLYPPGDSIGLHTYAQTSSPVAVSQAAGGVSASASANLGVLKASAATSTSTVASSANAGASYTDTLTFGRLGDGLIPISFNFALTGSVTGVSPTAGAVDFSMAILSASNDISSGEPQFATYLDGALVYADSGKACGNSSYYNAYECNSDKLFSYSSNGTKSENVSFGFIVTGGQSVREGLHNYVAGVVVRHAT